MDIIVMIFDKYLHLIPRLIPYKIILPHLDNIFLQKIIYFKIFMFYGAWQKRSG